MRYRTTTNAIDIAAGERRRILRRISNSVPMTYRFRAEPVDGDGPVSGIVEVKGSRWIFPAPPVTQPLGPINEVAKGAWDTVFTVTVVPDRDVTVTFEDGTIRSGRLLIGMAVAVVVVAAAVAAAVLFG